MKAHIDRIVPWIIAACFVFLVGFVQSQDQRDNEQPTIHHVRGGE